MEQNEQKICEEIYQENYTKIMWYLRKSFNSLKDYDIEDIMQDVWIMLMQNINQVGQREKGDRQAWVMTVTSNQACSFFRERNREIRLMEKVGQSPFGNLATESAENSVLNRITALDVLNNMPEKERQRLFKDYMDSEDLENKRRLTNVEVCQRYRARKLLVLEMLKAGFM